MKWLLVFLFLFSALHSPAQRIPDSLTYLPEKIAVYLQSIRAERTDQFRYLYSWITANIRYDKDSAMYFNWTVDHQTKITATLRRRKGVCENFASLLADISNRIGMKAYVVHGYPAYATGDQDLSHSWVAVENEAGWYLCDPTWDAQSPTEKYYLIRPSEFISTHIPFDPIWQLLDRPKLNKSNDSVNVNDSIAAFLKQDSLQQYLATERRIREAGKPNKMTETWAQYNRMNIAIIAGDRDMELYNGAVAQLNKANALFNEYVAYRNGQFLPPVAAVQLSGMLNPARSSLQEAREKIRNLGQLRENYQYDPAVLNERIINLEKKLVEQELFIRQYLRASPPDRLKLFLQ